MWFSPVLFLLGGMLEGGVLEPRGWFAGWPAMAGACPRCLSFL